MDETWMDDEALTVANMRGRMKMDFNCSHHDGMDDDEAYLLPTW